MPKKTAEQLQAEIHARAAVVKKAYEDWKAANSNNPYAFYTLEEQKKYLPKGFKNPKNYAFVGGWQKAKELGLDAYDQFGNIITRASMAPSWMGDAIGGGQYVAPNVTAAAMGMPDEEVNRILDITIASSGGDPSRVHPNWSRLGIFQGLLKPYAPPAATNPPATTTPTTTTPAQGTTPGAGNVTDAAKNLANAKQPTVPNFIQPYQTQKRGFGAYGERDIF